MEPKKEKKVTKDVNTEKKAPVKKATAKTTVTKKTIPAKKTVEKTSTANAKVDIKKDVVIENIVVKKAPAKKVTTTKKESETKTTISKKVAPKKIDEVVKVEVKKEVVEQKKEIKPVEKVVEVQKKVEREITNRDVLFIFIIAIVVIIALYSMVYAYNKNREKAKEENVDDKPKSQEFVVTNERGNLQNSSKELNNEKTYAGIVFKNVKLVKNNNTCIYSATVENKSGNEHSKEIVRLIFTDKNGNEIATLKAFIKDLKNGQTDNIISSVETDIINAYSYRIEKNG